MSVATDTHQLTLASIDIAAGVLDKFVESFSAFNIDTQVIQLPSEDVNGYGKIQGCVLSLTEAAVSKLKKASWFTPRRTVIYGLGSANKACRFGDLGVNVLVKSRADAEIRAAVNATQSLIWRGMGKCARVPIALPVRIDALGKAIPGITTNVGSGGIAVQLLRQTGLPSPVTLSLILPGLGPLVRKASARWYSGNLVGFQLHPPVEDSVLVEWVQQYSRLGA
jgi:hypothetical protein